MLIKLVFFSCLTRKLGKIIMLCIIKTIYVKFLVYRKQKRGFTKIVNKKVLNAIQQSSDAL